MPGINLQAYWIRDALIKDREQALRHVADILRSDVPISSETRSLLANILDPNGSGDWKVKITKRGGKGPVAGAKAQQVSKIGAYLEEAIDEQRRPYETALADAMKTFGISRTTAASALNSRREGRRIMDEIEEETGERPDAVFTS